MDNAFLKALTVLMTNPDIKVFLTDTLDYLKPYLTIDLLK